MLALTKRAQQYIGRPSDRLFSCQFSGDDSHDGQTGALLRKKYMIDLNAAQAAIRAGCSNKFATSNAQKLLQNTAIRARIDRALSEETNPDAYRHGYLGIPTGTGGEVFTNHKPSRESAFMRLFSPNAIFMRKTSSFSIFVSHCGTGVSGNLR